MSSPRVEYDGHGTPGIRTANIIDAYDGIGYLHGLHRPLQALLLATAARGRLAECVLPIRDLLHLDTLAHRLDPPRKADAACEQLDASTAAWVDAYCAGFARGLRDGGTPFELRVLTAKIPPLDRGTVLAGLMLSAYLGLAEGQERMERAVVACLAAGGDAALLETMFAPHLPGWDSARLRALAHTNQGSPGIAAVGGSNAWALRGERTASGRAMLCGDPHLQINQMPAVFFELRMRVGNDYWLGATIPGLPGIAVGRNRNVAWSGTFAVADNVDFTIESLEALACRNVRIKHRFAHALNVNFYSTPRGQVDSDGLAVRWAGSDRPAEALAAYMRLPLATSAAEACRILHNAHALSLHFVLADRSGDVHYQQAGRIPKRSAGRSGLYPVPAHGGQHWTGMYEGTELPHAESTNGFVATANEARTPADGGVLSTLAQPTYRLNRIESVLASRRDHDRASMQALQRDLVSLQAKALVPHILAALPDGQMKSVLTSWNCSFDSESLGAHAFTLAYRALLRALAPELGGDWFTAMVSESELSVWWCAALDRILLDAHSWRGARGACFTTALSSLARADFAPWGSVQTFTLRHMVFGDLPRITGLHRGPYALPGHISTVSQGNVLSLSGKPVAIGAAYRMICEFNDDAIYTTLPGGVDGSCFTPSYDCWINEWRTGGMHRVEAP